MFPTAINDPKVIARADYWWERCLYRLLQRHDEQAAALRALVSPLASTARVADLVWPST